MKTAIVIPARFASTRLPGKPLIYIRNQTLLERVVRLSQTAAADLPDVSILVATDDARIQAHCDALGVTSIMTASALPTGTDRVAEAIRQLPEKPDFILNMQGDAPFTPPEFLRALIAAFIASPCDVITPVTQLTWSQLDALRDNKRSTPFSGTTATFNPQTGDAFWFSKHIIPALRNETALRETSELSPVYRHIGLYGYSQHMLTQYCNLPIGHFETLEGLEQLRLIEHGYRIRCVPVKCNTHFNLSGIDSPEDIVRAEQLITHYGELLQSTASSCH